MSGDGNHFIRQDNHLEIIEQILVQQNKRIEELSAYKDQSSALFTALKTELNGLDATDFDPDSDSHLVEPQKSAQDVGKAFKMELDCLENTLNIKINGLEEKVGIALALTTGDQEATDGARGAVSRRRNIAKPHGTMGDEEIVSSNEWTSMLPHANRAFSFHSKTSCTTTKSVSHTSRRSMTPRPKIRCTPCGTSSLTRCSTNTTAADVEYSMATSTSCSRCVGGSFVVWLCSMRWDRR